MPTALQPLVANLFESLVDFNQPTIPDLADKSPLSYFSGQLTIPNERHFPCIPSSWLAGVPCCHFQSAVLAQSQDTEGQNLFVVLLSERSIALDAPKKHQESDWHRWEGESH